MVGVCYVLTELDIEEFVAHSANVNCIKIGKKTHRNFITGGDDEKVNLWSIGKPSATTVSKFTVKL